MLELYELSLLNRMEEVVEGPWLGSGRILNSWQTELNVAGCTAFMSTDEKRNGNIKNEKSDHANKVKE